MVNKYEVLPSIPTTHDSPLQDCCMLLLYEAVGSTTLPRRLVLSIAFSLRDSLTFLEDGFFCMYVSLDSRGGYVKRH